MEWETISTLNLVNLANQLFHIFYLKVRPQKFLIFSFSKWRLLRKIQTFLVLLLLKRDRKPEKKIVTNVRALEAVRPFSVLPILKVGALRNHRSSPKSSLLIILQKHVSISTYWGWISSDPNWHWSHALSA